MSNKSAIKKSKKTKLKHLHKSMYTAICEIAKKQPNSIAMEYSGKRISYKDFLNLILKCSASLKACGIKRLLLASVSLTIPTTSGKKTFSIPLPEHFPPESR